MIILTLSDDLYALKSVYN